MPPCKEGKQQHNHIACGETAAGHKKSNLPCCIKIYRCHVLEMCIIASPLNGGAIVNGSVSESLA